MHSSQRTGRTRRPFQESGTARICSRVASLLPEGTGGVWTGSLNDVGKSSRGAPPLPTGEGLFVRDPARESRRRGDGSPRIVLAGLLLRQRVRADVGPGGREVR